MAEVPPERCGNLRGEEVLRCSFATLRISPRGSDHPNKPTAGLPGTPTDAAKTAQARKRILRYAQDFASRLGRRESGSTFCSESSQKHIHYLLVPRICRSQQMWV